MVTGVEEMGSEEILAAVEAVYREQVEGNATLFRFAYEFATIHNGDAANASGRVLPGTERAIRIGGAGTPRVMEFAAVQFGAPMQLGSLAARNYLADALDVWHRLPLIAARLEAGEVKVSYARHVAKETRHLSLEATAKVDADMVEVADGRLPWTRFCERLDGRIKAADPELAAEREREAEQREFARRTRETVDGMAGFYIRGPAAWIIRIDATVAYLAEALRALGDTDNEDARRLKAMVVLANPTLAVELMAAFAAHRARVTDQPLPVDLPDDEPAEPGAQSDEDAADAEDEAAADDEREEPADSAESASEPAMSGSLVPFVRPLPFRPTDLPGWLTRLAHSCDGSPESEDPTGGGDGGDGWSFSWPKLLPQVTMFVHVARETLDEGEGVVRWEGAGSTTWDYLRDLVIPFQTLKFAPVIDLAGQEPVDAYEIPQRHRQAVHLRTPADCFPYSSTTPRKVDIDHTEEYEHAPEDQDASAERAKRDDSRGKRMRGQSRMDNYGPLGRFHHRVKTHGHWTVKQPFDGIYVWRDPSGEFFLVDHTGTRKVTDGTWPTRKKRRDACGIDLYETDFRIDLDLA